MTQRVFLSQCNCVWLCDQKVLWWQRLIFKYIYSSHWTASQTFEKLQVGHLIVLKIFEKVCLCFQHFSWTNQRDYIFVQVSVVLCLEVVVAFLIQVTIFHDPVRFAVSLSQHCIYNKRLICFLCQNLTMHTRPTGLTYWVPCASFWLSLEWLLKARWIRRFRY